MLDAERLWRGRYAPDQLMMRTRDDLCAKARCHLPYSIPLPIIDSMSHIFRAFYAPLANRAAPLMTSKGQVTQAVYIFTNMLRKLIQDEKPKYIAAISESKEKTFRHETFADYKATRLA